MNIDQIAAPECHALMRLKLKEKLAGLPRTTYEIEMVTREGGRRFVEVSSRLSYTDGLPTGVISIARDITDRKETDRALRHSELRMRQALEARVRLGRDLHDGIIQSIYAVGLSVEDCRRSVASLAPLTNERLARCLADLNAIIREVRSFIMGLEVDESELEAFPAALQNLVQTMNECQSSVRFESQIEPDAVQLLAPHQTHDLLQIAREAVTNSLRHARARQCVLSLWTEGQQPSSESATMESVLIGQTPPITVGD